MFLVADLASCHDGDLQRAKDLIWLAKECGANAAKFQLFKAETLINQQGFSNLGFKGHQKNWKENVFNTYKKYSVPLEWLPELSETCKKAKIEFMATPYDLESLEAVDKYVNFHKIGSGDINYFDMLVAVAKKGKPILLGTGASTTEEVIQAASLILQINPMLTLMQCNTNYSGEAENYKFTCVNVLKGYKTYFPKISLGLSDHTKNNKAILAAQALGAEFIERHLTDGKSKSPDNDFALNPMEWKYMTNEIQENAFVLGNTFKEVQYNEVETRVLQRRCLVAKNDLKIGHTITLDDVVCLRPAPYDSLPPNPQIVIGQKTSKAIKKFDYLKAGDIKFDVKLQSNRTK